jgi:hypothetical protein
LATVVVWRCTQVAAARLSAAMTITAPAAANQPRRWSHQRKKFTHCPFVY